MVRRGEGIAILAFGSMVATCRAVADRLDATLINMRFVKPLDEALVLVRETIEPSSGIIVVDLYGGGRMTANPDEAGAWMNALRGDRETLRGRFHAALEAARTLDQAYPAKAAAIVEEAKQFLIEKKPLESVDPAKGRFRGFLLGVLRNYLANQRTTQNAQKRGGGRAV